MGAFLGNLALHLVDGSLCVPHFRFGILDVLARSCFQLEKPLRAITQAPCVRLGGSRTLQFGGCLLIGGSGVVDFVAVNTAEYLTGANDIAEPQS